MLYKTRGTGVKVYNSYILVIASLLLPTTVIMVFLGVNTLDVYYTAYIIEALVATELYVYFNAKARRGLNLISAMLFGGFLVVIYLQAMKILA